MNFLMNRVIFTLLLSILYLNNSAMAGSDDAEHYPGDTQRKDRTTQTNNFGEIINDITGELGFEVVDGVIPGSNGMDIVISRSYGSTTPVMGYQSAYSLLVNWHFEIPRVIIKTTPWGITRGWQPEHFDEIIKPVSTTRTGICNDPYPGDGRASQLNSGRTKIANRYWSGIQLKIPGQPAQQLIKKTDTTGRYPSSAKWVSTSNWVASCTNDGNGFIVKSPAGITYTMDVLEAIYNYNGLLYSFSQPSRNTLFVSKIEDVHGNVITYNYAEMAAKFETVYLRADKCRYGENACKATNYDSPRFYSRLNSITRNDAVNPQTVTLNYTTDTDYSIDSITANDRTWTYNYALDNHVGKYEFYLESVENPNGTKWQYKYEGEKMYRIEEHGFDGRYGGVERLTQVTLPGGATVDYTYKDFGKLKNDPFDENLRLETKTVKDGTTLIDKWEFDYKNGSNDTIEVTATRGNDITTKVYENDKSFQHGKLLSLTQKRLSGSSVVDKRTSEFTYAEQAVIGEFQFMDYPKDIPDSLTRKVKLTKKTITEHNNTYTTEYLEHDKYGKPTKIKETFGDNVKYTKLGYYNNSTNWILGLPTTVKVSKDDSSYTTVSEIVYHDSTSANGIYANKGLPYQSNSFGRWTTRYPQYTTRGELKKEEYNVARTVGEGNRFTKYDNYKRGIAQAITIPARKSAGNISRTKTVDNNGWVTQETDFNNITTKYRYDKQGRIQSIDYGDDTTSNNNWQDVLYTWSDNATTGRTRTMQRCKLLDNDADAACSGDVVYTEVETYDGLLRLASLSQNDGNNTRYQTYKYDKFGHQTFESYWQDTPNKTKGVSSHYDGLGRLESTTTTGLGSVKYDYLSGNKIKVTDAKKNVTTTTYLAYGSPSYELATKISSPERITTSIDIDVLGLTKTIKQSGFNDKNQAVSQTESYYYNTYKQLCLTVRQDTGAQAFNYNALGETNWHAEGVSYNTTNPVCIAKPANKAVTYILDNLGEVKSVSYPDSTGNVSYTKDNNGNLTALSAGSVSHAYTYNNQNLLESETLTVDGKSLSLVYDYNNMMHLSALTYPDDTKVTLTPNSFGEQTESQVYAESGNNESTVEHSFAHTATYHPNGTIKSFTYGNGVTHTTTLHSDSFLPKRLNDAQANVSKLDLSYEYDDNANVYSITDGLSSNAYGITRMQYDGLNRLTYVDGNSGLGDSTIQYDYLGNIKSYTSKGRSLSYTYKNHRLDSVTGFGSKYSSFSYDDRGNVTHNGARGFTFNRANQLTNSGTNTYLYDGFNRRAKQSDASGVSYSMYSQAGVLLYREKGDFVGNGTNYIYLGTKLIAKFGDVTPAQSVEASRQHYRPFGDTLKDEKTDDIGYTGHKYDKDIGLSYMQARYYDPVIGRFYSNDPVGFTGSPHSFNRYAYVNNNPYKYTDPSGQIAESVWDAASLSMGLSSLGNNLWQGNWGAAGIDALGVILDGAALAMPVVPGGAGMFIKGSREAANSAEAAADAALASGKKSGAAAELRVGDKVYTGVSGEIVKPNPQVTGALMGTPASARKPWHGGCAEIVCLDKALNDGVDVSGGTIRAVNIGASGNGHGTAKKICTSCNDVLNHLGVKKQ
ncbi:RHS repeat-associated core domain-containing protein [Pseudoalteromonas sp. S16_S37]|uniref:RHS repeat-associated core domain-containing protein n=1 Tax=Pseudoalteromonas sp. S16_S37 TaxID=2720228 RepID=UPI0016816E20|nr:RHS repeat-associated core domain-containing protein [Pseudoalteromonas sp. S16_S37]MBD1581433.1 hypothetical protein [Pseudoalteromonas sp. S16_S37]